MDIKGRNCDCSSLLSRRYAAAVLLDLTYGYRVTKDDDELVLVAEEAMAGTAKAGGCVFAGISLEPPC